MPSMAATEIFPTLPPTTVAWYRLHFLQLGSPSSPPLFLRTHLSLRPPRFATRFHRVLRRCLYEVVVHGARRVCKSRSISWEPKKAPYGARTSFSLLHLAPLPSPCWPSHKPTTTLSEAHRRRTAKRCSLVSGQRRFSVRGLTRQQPQWGQPRRGTRLPRAVRSLSRPRMQRQS